MRNATSWLSGMVLGCLATSGAAAEEHPRELRLVLIDLVGVTPLARDEMWREARRLLAPRGVTLHARPGRAAEQRDGSELAVVFVPERSRAPRRGGPPLGAVQTVETFTTIWIDVSAVAAVVDARRGLHCCGVETRRLGLALGRVLTHELVHVLEPSLGHAPRGLMAARVTRATLVDDPTPETARHVAKRLNSSGVY